VSLKVPGRHADSLKVNLHTRHWVDRFSVLKVPLNRFAKFVGGVALGVVGSLLLVFAFLWVPALVIKEVVG
jgi:hypothetical protein